MLLAALSYYNLDILESLNLNSFYRPKYDWSLRDIRFSMADFYVSDESNLEMVQLANDIKTYSNRNIDVIHKSIKEIQDNFSLHLYPVECNEMIKPPMKTDILGSKYRKESEQNCAEIIKKLSKEIDIQDLITKSGIKFTEEEIEDLKDHQIDFLFFGEVKADRLNKKRPHYIELWAYPSYQEVNIILNGDANEYLYCIPELNPINEKNSTEQESEFIREAKGIIKKIAFYSCLYKIPNLNSKDVIKFSKYIKEEALQDALVGGYYYFHALKIKKKYPDVSSITPNDIDEIKTKLDKALSRYKSSIKKDSIFVSFDMAGKCEVEIQHCFNKIEDKLQHMKKALSYFYNARSVKHQYQNKFSGIECYRDFFTEYLKFLNVVKGKDMIHPDFELYQTMYYAMKEDVRKDSYLKKELEKNIDEIDER